MTCIKTVASYIKSVVDGSWLMHPGFKYGEHEGYKATRLGFKAGPSYDIFNLLHEVAHVCEIKAEQLDRLLYNNYGLGFSDDAMVYLCGRELCQPKNMQATERECRVFAIQKHVTESLNLPVPSDFFEENADTLLSFMPDNFYGGKTEEARLQHRIRIMQQHYDNIDKQGIMAKWNTAMKYIQANHAD